MTLTRQLADFASSPEPLPGDVASSVKQRVLDILGIQIAALTLQTSKATLEHVARQGGAPEAIIPGLADALPAASAAFASGVLAHSLDYDDTHVPSVLHPSASVIPAALSAGQAANANGTQLMHAIAAGIETCVRLGMAGYDRARGNSLFFERGQHATSICGALGSAVSAAMLLGLDAEGIAHALGIAASMGSGILEGNRAGGTVKRLHCGFAAQSGVNAALLAQAGFTGPPTALEGRFGFFQAWIGNTFDADAITSGLGSRWELPGIFFKPYPANHFTHAGIDAAIEFRSEGLQIDAIQAITMGVPTPCVRTIGEPIEAKRAPDSGYQAQFSGPYTIAAALMGGSGLGLGLEDFTDSLAQDPIRRNLMQKVAVVGDAECDAIYPMQFPAVLTITTRDGSVATKKVLASRGGPKRPLSDEELRIKFDDNAMRVLEDKVAQQIAEATSRLDTLDNIADLIRPAALERKQR